MKTFSLLIVSLVTLFLPHTHVQAEEAEVLPKLTQVEISQKIKAKESFYLFVGRPDNVDTQKALKRLSERSETIYYLNTKEAEKVSYRKFAKKYKIKSGAHLAHFKGKTQTNFLPNVASSTLEEIEQFFQLSAE